MNLPKRTAAEFFGTFWLVLGGCGAAVLSTNPSAIGAGGYDVLSIGYLGVALAFGLSAMAAIYAVGHISGGHLNPAVSAGMVIAGRLSIKDAVAYGIAQVLGATGAAGVLYLIASGLPEFELFGFAANGYGDTPGSPGHYSLQAALICELAMTFFFVLVVLGATDRKAPAGFAPLAIGVALVAVHLVSIPVTGTSVNPARSFGPAVFVQSWAAKQLWVFWAAPIAGAVLAGIVHRYLLASSAKESA